MSDSEGEPEAILIATGSEVGIALDGVEKLANEGVHVRLVSMPSFEAFAAQPAEYRNQVLGGDLPKVAVEAGIRFGWDTWIGPDGGFVGMTGFGASAPYKDLYQKFGITADAVVAAVKAKL